MTRAAGLPYAHLNLRTNPFRTLAPSERVEVAVVEVEGLARWIRDGSAKHGETGARRILQLLGPGGCGKTTHLEALHRLCPGAAMVAWSAEEGWPRLPPGEPLFVDDAQELPGRVWRAVRKRRRLVLATRVELRPLLADLAGELRTLRVEDMLTPDRMARMIARRMEWARRGPGPVPGVADEGLEPLLARHGSDARAVYDDLYPRIPAHPRSTS